MHRPFPSEFVFQVFSLLIAFIVVHAAYVTVVRPSAYSYLAEQAATLEDNPGHVTQQSFAVIIKDYEQEACFVLMLWALSILAYKALSTRRQQKLLGEDLLGLPDGMPVGIEDTRELASRLQSRPDAQQGFLLPRTLITAVERFSSTANVQSVSTAVRDVCTTEGERLESELSIIRYIAWAIPSIGFIGTVRGIGNALGQAHLAVEGNITGVTESLGVAFNSTFIALVISIVLMFFIYQLQLMQERLVLDTGQYVDHWLVRRLRP